jgi:divalent metal cation (Fe/Co/Zn/Cd) transporter
VPGIKDVEDVRLRWTGHRLNVEATVTSDPTLPVGLFHELEHQADRIIRGKLSGINAVRLNPSAHPPASPTPELSPLVISTRRLETTCCWCRRSAAVDQSC